MIYTTNKNFNTNLSKTNKFIGWGHKNYNILQYIKKNPDCTRLEILEALGYDITKRHVGSRTFFEMMQLGAICVECMRRPKGCTKYAYEYRITDYGLKILKECEKQFKLNKK